MSGNFNALAWKDRGNDFAFVADRIALSGGSLENSTFFMDEQVSGFQLFPDNIPAATLAETDFYVIGPGLEGDWTNGEVPGRWGPERLATQASYAGANLKDSARGQVTIQTTVKIIDGAEDEAVYLFAGSGSSRKAIKLAGKKVALKAPPAAELAARRNHILHRLDAKHDSDPGHSSAIRTVQTCVHNQFSGVVKADTDHAVAAGDLKKVKKFAADGGTPDAATLQAMAKMLAATHGVRAEIARVAKEDLELLTRSVAAHKLPQFLGQVRLAYARAWDITASGGGFPYEAALETLANLSAAVEARKLEVTEGQPDFAQDEAAIGRLLTSLPSINFGAPVSVDAWKVKLTAAAVAPAQGGES